MENGVRDKAMTDPIEISADFRLHAFNKTYPTQGGVPVELSVFEVR
jgi:hypothetical protein